MSKSFEDLPDEEVLAGIVSKKTAGERDMAGFPGAMLGDDPVESLISIEKPGAHETVMEAWHREHDVKPNEPAEVVDQEAEDEELPKAA